MPVLLNLGVVVSGAVPWYEREKPGNALLAFMCFALAVLVAHLGLLHLDDKRRAVRREIAIVGVGLSVSLLGQAF